LGIARAHVQARDEAVEVLLQAIIHHGEAEGLTLESLEARSELLRLYQHLGKVNENIPAFSLAWAAVDNSWSEYKLDKESTKSLEMIEIYMKLACAFLKGNFEHESKTLFRRVEEKATNLYTDIDDRTIWILISIGLVYQNDRGWDTAKPWFQQALAFSYNVYDSKDGIAVSLEAALRKCHFSYVSDEGRPFKTIFGVNGIVIRPGRLHIE
jgi:tetratricopeptide (TPR) repeat protein